MSIARKVTEGAGGGGSGGSSKYVDDVFSTYLYEGDQSNTNRDLVNGIDLDDKGGLVWIKLRSTTKPHYLFDTERGAGKSLSTNSTEFESPYNAGRLRSFNTDGFSLGDSHTTNETGEDFASWTFAKQEGFFDVVTYTGDGVAGREIPHNLGSEPGMIIVKATNRTGNARDWMVYHRSLNGGTTPENYYVRLNLVNTESTSTAAWNDTAPTAQAFTLGNSNDTNENGYEYVAYVFAHDAQEFGPNGDESIIKCGSYTGTGVAGLEVDLGWEPQYVMIKSADDAYNWYMYDAMRGIVTGGNDSVLNANESSAESTTSDRIKVTPTGFTITASSNGWNKAGSQFIYMAIRRPMKPAEEFEPDELFAIHNADGSNSLPGLVSDFPVGMGFRRAVNGTSNTEVAARLMQGKHLLTHNGNAALANSYDMLDYNNGYLAYNHSSIWGWMFRRAPGFFDVVTYEGGQGTDAQIPHNLQVRPEMIWLKALDDADSGWCVWAESYENTAQMLYLNYDLGLSTSYFGSTPEVMTDEVFQIGGNSKLMNGAGKNYIAFLWASVPGISKVGSYTGNGSNDGPEVECGFVPRFVLIKNIDDSGSWYVVDAERGFTKVLALETTAAQVSEPNWIAQTASGFKLGNNAIQINANGKNYLFYAIA